MAYAERQDNQTSSNDTRTPEKPGPMSETRLRAVVSKEIQQAIDYIDGEIGEDRRSAMDLYYAEPFGNEVEGRSAVISTDVQDTVESVMPALLEIFAGGDEVVRFEPVGPEDEEIAKQATEYVTHVITKDNPGFTNTHDVIKDGLLQKNGILKVWWDDTPVVKQETLSGVNELRLQELTQDEEVEILEHNVQEDVQPIDGGELHEVKLRRTILTGRTREMAIPPEEFLISRRSVSLEDARFTCHKVQKTISDLREEGYPEEKIARIGPGDEEEFNEERQARYQDEEWIGTDDAYDPAMRKVWLYECYLKVDYDGDGIAEMRQITVAGGKYEILENEEVDDHPFVSGTPIRMAHKFFGRSLADLTEDIQVIKSTIQRQLLDNMYFVNNARVAISNKVNLDDYLANRPGQAVRVDTDGADAAGHIQPIVTDTIGDFAYPLLEYFDSIRETRTGVTRYNQGLDADSLNKTATGINQILGQAQKRLLLIARVLAETLFKDRYKKHLRLLINHQDRARVIRLRNQWVEMDPRSWNADMDLSINVGLGYGTKESQAVADQLMLSVLSQIVEFQQGIDGPIVTREGLHYFLKRFAVNQGYKDPDALFADPQDPENQPQPQPDPEMMKVQAEIQLEERKMQMELQKDQAKLQLEREKHQLEMQVKLEEAKLEMQIEMMKANQQMQLQQAEAQQDMEIERETADLNMAVQASQAQTQNRLAEEKGDRK